MSQIIQLYHIGDNMKRYCFLLFLSFLFNCAFLYAVEIRLEDKYSFNYETNKIDYLSVYYFQDYLFFDDIYYIKEGKLIPIFELNEKFFDYYAKYKISSEILTNSKKNELYYRFYSLVENKTFYTVKLSLDRENLSLKKTEVNYDSIKNDLFNLEWINFPYHFVNDLFIDYSYDEKNKSRECNIKKGNETVFDFNQLISSNEIIFPPEINDRKSKITIITKCKNQENELILKNGVEVYELFIFSIIYDATLNDTRVRLRSEPNLSCETLGYLEKGDAVKIVDRSDEKFEIDGENWYWYEVETSDGKTGWIYGKYLDIEE